jgi:hypothetical protein
LINRSLKKKEEEEEEKIERRASPKQLLLPEDNYHRVCVCVLSSWVGFSSFSPSPSISLSEKKSRGTSLFPSSLFFSFLSTSQ